MIIRGWNSAALGGPPVVNLQPADPFQSFPLDAGVTLHVHRAPAFKTLSIHVFLQRPLDEGTTDAALLPDLLRSGCHRHPTRRALATYLETLYGASLSTGVFKFGERHLLQFRLDGVNDRFLPGRTRVLARALGLLRDLVTAPVLERGLFPADAVAREKANRRNLLDGLVNERASWAFERCVAAMCADEPFRRYPLGESGCLDSVTPGTLRDRHLRLLREAPVDIVVTGDVRGPEVAAAVARAFRLRGRAPAALPRAVPRPAPASVREVREPLRVEQGRLVIGLRTGITLADAAVDALGVANGILGAFPHSKLFRNVREREGLAYDVRSWLERTKGLLFIQAGIDPAKYAAARDVILGELGALQRGEISDEEWESTRSCLLDRLRALEDAPSRLAVARMEGIVNGRVRTPSEVREAVQAVTREDVVEAARRVRPDTIYFLAPP
jgi:predicted Zn-dependent peptidase